MSGDEDKEEADYCGFGSEETERSESTDNLNKTKPKSVGKSGHANLRGCVLFPGAAAGDFQVAGFFFFLKVSGGERAMCASVEKCGVHTLPDRRHGQVPVAARGRHEHLQPQPLEEAVVRAGRRQVHLLRVQGGVGQAGRRRRQPQGQAAEEATVR